MNEVAEKIKEEFDISLMPSDRITLVWDDCEKFLQKSCNRSNGRATTKDIFYDCIRNVCSLWIIFDKETLNITGCAITKISQYPTGKRMLNLDHVAGKNMEQWMNNGLDVLKKYAKDNNCNGLEGVGRDGFWHWIKNKNWKRTAIFVEYNFEEEK